MAAGGRLRAEARDRVVVVASAEDVSTLARELPCLPERPASIAASMTVTQAAAGGLEQLGLASVTGTGGLAVLVLDEEAQRQPRVVAQAAVLHSMGARVRSLTLFYEEWLGKLPIPEPEPVGREWCRGREW